ncbi:MAG: DUF1015 domain-containing protein [Candidatus Kryptoniota bacterium]
MAIIRPFRAIYYNQKITDLSKVVAPPYDVIDKKLQDELYNRSPYNVIRLDLNRESDPYVSASRELERMLKENILLTDNNECIYPYFQTFHEQEGKEVTRRGFVAWIKLEPFESGVVLPHERTLSKPKEDRLNLMLSTNATFSQIFGLYSDREMQLETIYESIRLSQPFLTAEYDSVINVIYRIEEENVLTKFKELMSTREVYIADGHHRYETALEYQKIMKSKNPNHTGGEPYNFIMMYFTNIFDSGLVIYPTHRIIHSLEHFNRADFIKRVSEVFELQIMNSIEELGNALKYAGEYSFGLVLPTKQYYIMKLHRDKDATKVIREDLPAPVKKLDVTLLHDYVLDQVLGISRTAQERKLNINYTVERSEVDEAVQSGKAQLGFLLNPTKVQQVQEVAQAHAVMPQKSTYFYPKLLSGILNSRLV